MAQQQRYSAVLESELARKVDDAARQTGLSKTDVMKRFVEQGNTAALMDAAPALSKLIQEIRDRLSLIEHLYGRDREI